MGDYQDSFNTYGLNQGYLNKLGIQGPLYHKIFVANVSIVLHTSRRRRRLLRLLSVFI